MLCGSQIHIFLCLGFRGALSDFPLLKMSSSCLRERNWSAKLENVLNDHDALQQFFNWMGVDPESHSDHPLRLHFAIIAYKRRVEESDPLFSQLAKSIFEKFLKPKVGLCDFINLSIREDIGKRVAHLTAVPQAYDARIFDPCLPQLDEFLRKQHALFVCSPEFIEFFNSTLSLHPEKPLESSTCLMPKSSSAGARKGRKSHSKEGQCAETSVPRLTADSLARTQRDRESLTIGQSSVKKMFATRPVSKYPYIGNATTSKNDSAVSSSLSGDHQHHHRHHARMMREEHRRINPNLMYFPLPEQPPTTSNNQYRHETPEGRQKFVEELVGKLQIVIAKNKEYEWMREQMEKIAKGANNRSAREVLRETAIAGEDFDADDDVDKYFKLRMNIPDSQQSPIEV